MSEAVELTKEQKAAGVVERMADENYLITFNDVNDLYVHAQDVSKRRDKAAERIGEVKDISSFAERLDDATTTLRRIDLKVANSDETVQEAVKDLFNAYTGHRKVSGEAAQNAAQKRFEELTEEAQVWEGHFALANERRNDQIRDGLQ